MARRKTGLTFRRKQKKTISKNALKNLLSWLFWIVISVFTGIVLVYAFGFRTNVISNSMEPVLYSGQSILIDRFIYSISSAKRNDVVAFVPNGNEKSHLYIKRVVGLPGETLEIKDGYLYIDGNIYEDDYLYDKIADPGILEAPLTLGPDEYFMLGDNRNFSEDSRSGNIGTVKSSYIFGKVWFVIGDNLKDIGFVK